MGGHREVFGEVMLELDHYLAHVTWHEKMHLTFCIIPFKIDSTVQNNSIVQSDQCDVFVSLDSLGTCIVGKYIWLSSVGYEV